MISIYTTPTPFEEIIERTENIRKTEITTAITEVNRRNICDASLYTDYGLGTLGKMVGFPAPFINKVYLSNPSLANDVIKDRVDNYFSLDSGKPFFTRSFEGKICGVVSNKYSYFDDYQVVDILSNSSLADMSFQDTIITPERFHTRIIDTENPFTIDNDNSPLYFAYFVDNSMVGQSSFKVQLGVFRLHCKNGMIIPLGREFVICKQVHRGKKNISEEFNQNIAFLEEKKEVIRNLLADMSMETSQLEKIQEEFKADYISKKLNTNKKETESILKLYNEVYDGKSKWGLANAITEFARDLKDINRREYIERLAYKIA